MRKFLLLALFPVSASAAPFVVADLADQTTTHCAISVDGGAYSADVPVQGSPKVCKHDLSAVAAGSHTVTLKAVKVDPVWGRQESVASAPFTFTRPAGPPPPNGLRFQ